MPTIRFTDGVSINTDGPYRIIEMSDDLFVVGHGYLCSIKTREEGEQIIAELDSPMPTERNTQ